MDKGGKAITPKKEWELTLKELKETDERKTSAGRKNPSCLCH